MQHDFTTILHLFMVDDNSTFLTKVAKEKNGPDST